MSDLTDPTSFGGDHLGRVCKYIGLFYRKSRMLILGTARSTLVCATSEARIAVTLRQHHTLRQGQDMGTCSIDCSSLPGTHCKSCYAIGSEIRLTAFLQRSNLPCFLVEVHRSGS